MIFPDYLSRFICIVVGDVFVFVENDDAVNRMVVYTSGFL